MDTVIKQRFCNIQGRDIPLVFFLLQCHDELMHTGMLIGHLIVSGELMHHIVGVEDCRGGCLRDPLFSKGQDVAKGTYNYQEVR